MTRPVESLPLLYPTAEETDLLRACLWSDAPAREAWVRWLRAVGNPEPAIRNNRSGVKSLLPLLHYGLRRSGAVAESGVASVLASATLAEKLRYEAYTTIAARAFAALAGADVPFLVLRGAALSATAYPERTLRHSHDLDLLIHAADRTRAIDTLHQARFAETPTPYNETRSARLLDPSGLPVALHDRLYRFAFYTPPLDQVWARAQRHDVAGHSVLLLSAPDQLAHVCGHASCSASRDGLKWVADAWYVIERNPGLEWARLVESVRAGRLALPLAALLRYLAVEMEAAVPAGVLDELARVATDADRPAREVALAGLRAGRRGTFRNLSAATRSWAGRVDLVRWMLFPSPVSLRLGEPLRHVRVWPAYYLARPLAYVTRRARRLFSSRA
jgi:hypothetical protein